MPVQVNTLVSQETVDDLPAIYELLFNGKCGGCEYQAICGSSRARAFAYIGDPLGSDPFCPYQPAGFASEN
jgi:MoaA/NifB/PqqE/SkfB family radical SAM enzyme